MHGYKVIQANNLHNLLEVSGKSGKLRLAASSVARVISAIKMAMPEGVDVLGFRKIQDYLAPFSSRYCKIMLLQILFHVLSELPFNVEHRTGIVVGRCYFATWRHMHRFCSEPVKLRDLEAERQFQHIVQPINPRWLLSKRCARTGRKSEIPCMQWLLSQTVLAVFYHGRPFFHV